MYLHDLYFWGPKLGGVARYPSAIGCTKGREEGGAASYVPRAAMENMNELSSAFALVSNPHIPSVLMPSSPT